MNSFARLSWTLLVGVLPCCLIGGTDAAAIPDVGPGYDIAMSRMVRMRDGVELETWITKPSHLARKAPTILSLTQYDIDGGRRKDSIAFARRGFVFVQAYVRGRGRSGGVKSDNLGLQVGRDGHDLVEWIAAQPWSDGKVVMYGGSFVGMTQWHTAAQHPPHLTAIAPFVAIYPGWDVPNTNGIPQTQTALILGYVSGRSLNTGFVMNSAYLSGKLLEQYAAYRPFSELDDAVGIAQDDWAMTDEHGRQLSLMKNWLNHVGDEAFNLAAEPTADDYRRLDIPVLSVTGFYDDDQPGALRYYRRFMANAPASATKQHYLVIGPWDHFGSQSPTKEMLGLNLPDAAVIDMIKLQADWYDSVLGRGPRPDLLANQVNYFLMGANEWRHVASLETASSGEQTYFLSAPEGTPRDVFHSGQLESQAGPTEQPATLVSDPHELPELEVAALAASEDATSQFRAYQKRALVFHTEPLARDLDLVGQMHLVLTCSADAPDFDLWAQIAMVQPDGSSVRLGEDIRRARFRHGQFHEELVRTGEIMEIPFEFNWTAQRVPAGARLRLIVAPLNRPDFQKNFNTGGRIGYEKIEDARVATIKIYHDAVHPSRLVLPVAARTKD
ncbi:MAG TPA: CocE/NonD family hydrolase [Candidatus Didemnitutus sp.]|nr:CocE/NonD family hydrolase [Candidatus Didemnitutus sp.]